MSTRSLRLAWRGLPRQSVRLRLTAVYGGLFLLSAAALLAITYVVVSRFPGLRLPPRPPGAPPGGPYGVVALEQASRLHDLLVGSGIALSFMAVVSVGLGWLVAGRVLRPLRVIAATTKAISEDSLHERLALRGPDDEIKDLADTIDGLLGRLESAFDTQRSFVANASHELRTPLTLSQALVQMSLRNSSTTAAEFRSTCEDVLAAGQRQERLIESLLVLARSQRGLDHREPVDLAATATDVAENLQLEARARGVRLDVSTLPALASGDANLIEQLIANLVDNAIRYNAPGGRVQVLVQGHGDHVTLHVSNDGRHVSEDDVETLLQPFQRSTFDRVGDEDGVGLGLSIVVAIARAHGACLAVRARPHGGLDVRVTFPGSSPGSGPAGGLDACKNSAHCPEADRAALRQTR